VSLAWVASRAADLRPIQHRWRGVAGRVVTGAIVVALVVCGRLGGHAAPRRRSGRPAGAPLPGRCRRGRQPAGTTRSPGSEVQVQPDDAPGNMNRRRLLRVAGLPREERLRFVTLDTYDAPPGARQRDRRGTRADLFQRIARSSAAAGPGVRSGSRSRSRRRTRAAGCRSPPAHRPVVRLPRRPGATGPTCATTRDDDGDGARSPGRNDDYTFSAVLPDERLRSSMTPYPHTGRLQPAGAFLDPPC
jgi:hypothetical protein